MPTPPPPRAPQVTCKACDRLQNLARDGRVSPHSDPPRSRERCAGSNAIPGQDLTALCRRCTRAAGEPVDVDECTSAVHAAARATPSTGSRR